MLSSRAFSPLILALMLTTSPMVATATASAQTAAATRTATGVDATIDQRFLSFLDASFDAVIALSPESLTSLGLKQNYDRLDDYTDAGAQKEMALQEARLAQMKRDFDYKALSPASQLSYRLFEDTVTQNRLRFNWRTHIYPVNNSSSPTGAIPVFLINMHRVDSIADADAYIARLKDVERVMGEIATRLRTQAANGVVPPKFVFAPVEADARKIISGAPFDGGADSALLADFKKKVDALKVAADVKARLIEDARSALTGPFKRGYETILAAIGDVSKQANDNNGVWDLPNGEAYYADQLRYYTTTGMSPDEIHATGLAEVARIHREMNAIKDKVGFKGSLREFFTHVKADPRFQYPNTDAGKQAYLSDAKRYIAQVMAAAPRMFHQLPKAALEVRAVEPWRQETASVAFYTSPAPDGSRPGIYYVNLADMRQVLKPQIEAISYHEGAPGHHFQIAFAQEIQGMPKFRRFGSYGSYVEGWGLYSEKVAKELGFYRDPYSAFGQLSLELWRATRLVTDTGMHAKRWSREQAIDYFKQNTLLSDRDIVKEVERYLVWPGQATSYKVGELKILALRAKAEAALKDRFDVRDFHQVVLGNGALPLDILTEQVDAYIAAKSGSAVTTSR